MADFLDELLSKTDLVQLVSKYVSLTKKGNTYWGCCPFHHEKEPSFTVSQDKQLYYCFGCKEAGNAISFIKRSKALTEEMQSGFLPMRRTWKFRNIELRTKPPTRRLPRKRTSFGAYESCRIALSRKSDVTARRNR